MEEPSHPIAAVGILLADCGLDDHNNSDGADLGEDWVTRSVHDAACQSGCEAVAQDILNRIGGVIRTITPISAPFLGPYRDHSNFPWYWSYHTVVVLNGHVYDAFTGRFGQAIVNYKAEWLYPEAINFGF